VSGRRAGLISDIPEAMRRSAAVEAVLQQSGELADLEVIAQSWFEGARAAIERSWPPICPRCGCARRAARPICAGLSSHPRACGY
jgi:hypothetical protein